MTNALNSLGSTLALFGINFYRSHLSALKGYHCSAGAIGCRTCSTMAKRLFLKYPFFRAFFLQLNQFRRCKKSFKIIGIIKGSDSIQEAQARLELELNLPPYQAMLLAKVIGSMFSSGMGGAEKDCPCLIFFPCIGSFFKHEFIPGLNKKFMQQAIKYLSPCS